MKIKSKKKKKRTLSNSTKTSDFRYIPQEVWTLIFALLPAKTLLRFRCVCKTWCSLLDSPDFIKLFKINNNKLLLVREGLGHKANDGFLLTVRHADTLRKHSHILKSSQSRYHIYGSCNGLLLMQFMPQLANDPIKFSLWNPSIRKSLLLPSCPITCPMIGTLIYELGFAPSSKDYKVIAIAFDYGWHTCEPTQPSVAVYTLSNQQWTVRNNGLNIGGVNCERMFGEFTPSRSFYFEGAAHWFGCDPYGDDYQSYPFDGTYNMSRLTHLVSLDYDTEKFTFLRLPYASNQVKTLTSRFLFLLGESLSIFSISEVCATIWVLKQDKGEGVWTLWFSGTSSYDGWVLFSNSIGSKIFYNESGGGCIICRNRSYNIASGKVRVLYKSMSPHVDLQMYSESLVLCNGYGAQDLMSIL